MTDVSTVNNDVVTTDLSESKTTGMRAVAGIFAAANKREGWQQFLLFLIGLSLAVPVIAMDVIIMAMKALIGLNKMSRKLAWVIEKTGVLFPAWAWRLR